MNVFCCMPCKTLCSFSIHSNFFVPIGPQALVYSEVELSWQFPPITECCYIEFMVAEPSYDPSLKSLNEHESPGLMFGTPIINSLKIHS